MTEILEHSLPEPSLNITLEKKFIESYALRNELDSKQIQLNEYNISTSDYVKSLWSDIDKSVMQNSESTLEVKPINLKKELEVILAKKKIANDLIGSKIDEAIAKYNEILADIYDSTKDIDQRTADAETKSDIMKIFDQRKLIMSNLSLGYTKKQLFKETIALDTQILAIDNKFDKSYGRLINAYIQIGELDKANEWARRMKDIFGSAIASNEKYLPIFNNLESSNRRADERLNLLSKKSSILRKEDPPVSEIGDEEEEKGVVEKKRSRSILSSFVHLLFGGGLIIGSSVWLYYLFKNKQKFIR